MFYFLMEYSCANEYQMALFCKFSSSLNFQLVFVLGALTVGGIKLRCRSRLGPRKKGPECVIPYRLNGELHLECTQRFRPRNQTLERSLISVPLCPIR